MTPDEIMRLIESGTQAAVRRALASMATHAPIQHATVVELNTGGYGIHDVLLEGDIDPVPVMDITTGTPLNEGDRVTILFAPPHQALLFGRVGLTSEWVPYTPTFGGIVFDETTLPKRGRYTRTGNTVVAEGGFTLDGSHDVSGILTVSVPLPAHLSADAVRWLSGGRMFDFSTGGRYASIGAIDPTVDPNTIVNYATAGTSPWGTSTPVDWGNGDIFDFFITYETANDSP